MNSTIIAWLLVSTITGKASGLSFGPEFNSQAKCEQAVKMIKEQKENIFFSPSITCIRIEK